MSSLLPDMQVEVRFSRAGSVTGERRGGASRGGLSEGVLTRPHVLAATLRSVN